MRRKERWLLIIAITIGVCALAFDVLAVSYGFGGVGNLAILPMLLELLAVGLISYMMGRFAISLIYSLLLAGVCVAGEIIFTNTSALQLLGLVLFYAFLCLLPIVAVVCFRLGRNSGGRPR